VTQQQITCMESFRLKGGTVAWKEKPMANLIAKQPDGTDGWEFPEKFWISRTSTVRKDKPDTVVPRRLVVISEHTNDAVG
jgi:hypothetical protein